MDLERDTLKLVLKYLTNAKEMLCRLCLTSVGQHKISVDDCVKLDKPFISEETTYYEMFEDLGIIDEPLLPKTLCSGCSTTIINAYIYKRLIQYHNNRWNDMLSKIIDTVNCTKVLSESVKTIYLLINNDQTEMLTTRTTIKGPRKGIAKLKEILKYKQNYDSMKKLPLSVVCEECGKKFKSNLHLSKHQEREHNQRKYPCPQCPTIVMSQIQLEKHMTRVHLPKKYRCTKCDKMFTTDKLLDYHNKNYHMAVLCKLCFVQFPSKRELRTHMDRHDVLNCIKCGKAYYNKQTYKIHIKICGNKQNRLKFFCDICRKGYMHKAGIRSHIKTDHGFGINMYSCKWCYKKYDAASKLRNHMVVHTRERKFHCEKCGNKFVTQAALVNHTRLHTGERPFPCDLCDQSFISASRRMEHKHRMHFGPTKECPYCQVKFVLGSQLKKHVQRHYNPQSKLYIANLNAT